uniref:Aldehyde dehydrogenase n=1 Tax=uncultured Armatimonadetes bacterium TaxID=157466 RepID=A0A6J4I841_9BACT|nr:Aldehyde dehydrogenase [uncultured Armatimonadetes bacterium]
MAMAPSSPGMRAYKHETMTIPNIPILRRGQVYDSLDKAELKSVRTGEPVATVSQANAALIRRDLRRSSREALKSVPVARMLDICADAGRSFMEATLPLGENGTQSPQEYVEALSATSGLPHALVRRNMAKIHQVFTEMPTILRGLTRGMDLDVIDRGSGEQAGVPVSYFAVADALGVVLPSNSPGVNSLWMPAVALKVPVVLKPGREEPWTPFRIVQSFVAAGCPPEAFSFYPTDHEGSGAILESCGRALIFGDQSTVERYARNPAVQPHGPGWSKVLIGDDCVDEWPEFVDLIVASIAENGGRSCINASAVVVPRHADAIADAVAEKLAAIEPRAATDEQATLAGFANPKMAEAMDAAIDDGLNTAGAEEVTRRYRGGNRRVTRDGSTYLLPTLVKCRSFEHPLANREFLFPYASVVEVPQARMLDEIGPSLVVTALTRDEAFIGQILASSNVERLNIGPLPTTRVQWDQPHEGNLFEFLYRRRAIQRA